MIESKNKSKHFILCLIRVSAVFVLSILIADISLRVTPVVIKSSKSPLINLGFGFPLKGLRIEYISLKQGLTPTYPFHLPSNSSIIIDQLTKADVVSLSYDVLFYILISGTLLLLFSYLRMKSRRNRKNFLVFSGILAFFVALFFVALPFIEMPIINRVGMLFGGVIFYSSCLMIPVSLLLLFLFCLQSKTALEMKINIKRILFASLLSFILPFSDAVFHYRFFNEFDKTIYEMSSRGFPEEFYTPIRFSFKGYIADVLIIFAVIMLIFIILSPYYKRKIIKGNNIKARKITFFIVTVILAIVVSMSILIGSWLHTTKINPYYNMLLPEQKQQIMEASPEEIIRMYAQAINNKDYNLVLALFSPGYLRQGFGWDAFETHDKKKICEDFIAFISGEYREKSYDTLKNERVIISISDIKFDPSFHPLHPLPKGMVEFAVHYNRKDPFLAVNRRRLLRFITLKKSKTQGYYQILGFDTSP